MNASGSSVASSLRPWLTKQRHPVWRITLLTLALLDVVSCALASIAHRIVAFRRMQTVGFCLDAAEAILLTTTIHISGLNDAACLLAHSSFVRPFLGWHAEFTTDLLARH
jgi:hypothetical protein